MSIAKRDYQLNLNTTSALSAERGLIVNLNGVNSSQITPIETQEKKKKSIEEILLSLGVNESYVRAAIERRKVNQRPLHSVARDMGLVSAEKVAEAISIYTGWPYFKSTEVDRIDAEDIRRIAEFVDDKFVFNGFIPVGYDSEGRLRVAIPSQEKETPARNTFFQHKPVICVASEKTIQRAYRMYFAKTDGAFDIAKKAAEAALNSPDDEGSVNAIQRLIASLLRHAAYVGASDIYFFSDHSEGTLKLKIGGRGYLFRFLSKDLYDRVVSFLVMQSGKQEELNRAPQDSKVELKGEALREEFSDIIHRYVFRMSMVQAPGGSKDRTIVIRVNDSQSAESDFDSLGFDEVTSSLIRRYLNSPTGSVMVTGPTGSGKTTTLYAMLREINPIARAVFTMEKPIEYRHGSWIQHELGNEQHEGDEARTMLKALLREAPDVIMVGELRDDPDLIKTCLAAANTGHLVFATLHTNDAPSAIMRLTQLGAPKEVLSTVLKGILAQRLVSLLCPHCKEVDTRESTAKELNKPYLLARQKTIFRAKGCPHCNWEGFRGRAMVYELMDANSVRGAIEAGVALSVLRKEAYDESMSMWAKGLFMIADGLTSIDELVQHVDKP